MHTRGRPPLHWWWISLVLVGMGVAGSAHLLGRALALYGPSKPAALDICSALFRASCDAALADERFSFLNIPLAGWGLVYFSTLAGLLLLARFLEGSFETDALIAGSALAVAGLGAGIALTAGMLLGVAPLCPFCLALHAVSLALVFSLQRTTERPVAEQVQRLRDAASGLLRSRAETPESTRWQLVGFASVALVALLAYQWVYVESALRRPQPMSSPDRARLIADFQTSPQVLVPVTDLDPHLGPLTAPVQLVVFESFRCTHCQRLASGLSRLHQRFRDQLVVVYKHYPLSTHCNRQLPADLQPGACEIAWAAEAANQQSSFWPFHDAMLTAESPPSEESLRLTAVRLRLDPDRFDRDRRSDTARQRVADDVALGNQLKLPGTPAVFLNGRWVRAANAEVLEILVRHELARVAKSNPLDRAGNETGRPGRDGRSVRGGG
jgi:protein-disulfide isomerase/uncharacterized membrane protein